jgi:hypothetical protein
LRGVGLISAFAAFLLFAKGSLRAEPENEKRISSSFREFST